MLNLNVIILLVLNMILPIYLGYYLATKKWTGYWIALWAGILFFGIQTLLTPLLIPLLLEESRFVLVLIQMLNLSASLFIVWKIKDFGVKKFVPFWLWTLLAAIVISFSGIMGIIAGWLF